MQLLLANVFLAIADLFKTQRSLEAEVIRLRHENSVFRRRAPYRLHLTNSDRLFLVLLHWLWPEQTRLLLLVTPTTLLRWHRKGFRSYRRCKSRAARPAQDRSRDHRPHKADRHGKCAVGRAYLANCSNLESKSTSRRSRSICRAFACGAATRPGGHF